MSKISMRIDGMHCGACVRRVTQAIQSVPGASAEQVRVGGARVDIPDESRREALLEALGRAGFTAHVEQ